MAGNRCAEGALFEPALEALARSWNRLDPELLAPWLADDVRYESPAGEVFLFGRQAALMRKHGYGRVVNVSSGYGSMSEMGGRVAAYRLSKVALNALTRIVAAEVNPREIKVNAVDPGWVRTDMGGLFAPRSVELGAETIVWLATLPPDGPSGGFFHDKNQISW